MSFTINVGTTQTHFTGYAIAIDVAYLSQKLGQSIFPAKCVILNFCNRNNFVKKHIPNRFLYILAFVIITLPLEKCPNRLCLEQWLSTSVGVVDAEKKPGSPDELLPPALTTLYNTPRRLDSSTV